MAYVYRLYDATDTLLYVGKARQLLEDRWRKHRNGNTGQPPKPWWDSVARAEVAEFRKEEDALCVEAISIQYQDPLHNKRSEDSPHGTECPGHTPRTRYTVTDPLDLLHDADRPHDYEMPELASPWGNPEEELALREFDREVQATVLAVIQKAGKLGKEVLELWVFHGYSVEEVSEAIGATFGATRVRIHRGLKKLSEEDVATLYAAREYLNPHAKHPKSIDGRATSLLGLM